MLEGRGISAGYSGLQVVSEVDIDIAKGEWVALVGAAGAGKTTLMRTLAGALPTLGGRVGFDGEDITHVPAHGRVARGISLVPEGRRLFRGMTAHENLLAGAYLARKRSVVADRLGRVLELFPILAERRDQQVGTLSGGEQQMCAIGRALMAAPRLLLVDELSLGLAPLVVDSLFQALERIRAEGTTLLVVEQDVELSLDHADRGYVIRHGRIVAAGDGATLRSDPAFLSDFLGSAL